MKLLENIKSSIYSPSYYKEILNKPFSYSFRYFLSLMGLVALVATIVFSVSVLPEINKFINEISPKVMDYYPDNLEVTVKSGKVSTNVAEPYFIKLPAEFKNSDQGAGIEPPIEKMDNLLVIDTASPITLDLFRNYKTFVLLSRDSVAYDDNGAMKIQPLDQEINGVVTKAKVSAALDKVMPYLKILPAILAPIMFIFVFFGFIVGNLIYLVFGAFVIWLAVKAMKREFTYGKSYQIGLHAITLGVILEATIFTIYPNFEFPLLFTILMLAIVIVNLKSSADAEAPQSPVATAEQKQI